MRCGGGPGGEWADVEEKGPEGAELGVTGYATVQCVNGVRVQVEKLKLDLEDVIRQRDVACMNRWGCRQYIGGRRLGTLGHVLPCAQVVWCAQPQIAELSQNQNVK